MALKPLIELVKFVGGLGGLALSVFLLYDRAFRYRPSLFLIPPLYVAEFEFRYNNRFNANILGTAISGC
jgi:hypothetical protein